jgi:hypothetical protein
MEPLRVARGGAVVQGYHRAAGVNGEALRTEISPDGPPVVIRAEADARGQNATRSVRTKDGVQYFQLTYRRRQPRWLGYDRKAGRYVTL